LPCQWLSPGDQDCLAGPKLAFSFSSPGTQEISETDRVQAITPAFEANRDEYY
jgi:hypothetical protein